MDEEMDDAPLGTMITALCWVSKGFAKPVIDAYEPDEKILKKHKKLQHKISKGQQGEDIGKMAKNIENKMADVNLEGDSDDEDVPFFTPELARMKRKEMGEDVSDDEMDEDDP